MIRTLLATTAVAAVLALPVIAQDASSSMSSSAADSSMSSMDSSMSSMASSAMDTSSSSMASSSQASTDSSMMSSEASTDTSSMMSSEAPGPFDIVTGYAQIDSDRFATRIIGQPVFDSTAADANKLGDISDIVIDESGRAQAVVIGVGGFLGIGEKQVAVAYSALHFEIAADNTERYVVETTVDELTAAPDFVVVEDSPADGNASAPVSGDAMATSSSAAQ